MAKRLVVQIACSSKHPPKTQRAGNDAGSLFEHTLELWS
jgi:hypothetical protein